MSECDHFREALAHRATLGIANDQIVDAGPLWHCVATESCMSVTDARTAPHSVFYRTAQRVEAATAVEVVCCWCFLCKRECAAGSLSLLELTWSSTTTSSGERGPGSAPRLGLINCGNTCYANACIQALAACAPLREHLLRDLCGADAALSDDARLKRLQTAPLTFRAGEVIRQLSTGHGELAAVDPSDLLEWLRFLKPAFDRGSQQDSMECVRALLDGLHDENKCFVRKRQRVADAEPLAVLPALIVRSVCTPSSPLAAQPRKSLSASSSPKSPSPKSPSARPGAAAPAQLEEQSVVSCICSGLLLSRVHCLNCKNVSDTVDPFTDLPAPIPQDEALRRQIVETRKDDDAQERKYLAALGDADAAAKQAAGELAATPTAAATSSGWLGYVWSLLDSAPSEPLTLMDCLYAFFREEKLCGDNQYRCGSCNELSDAEKSYYLLTLPEVLCVHLKRFRHDVYGVGKLSEQVQFPVASLDLRRFYPERHVRSPLLREADDKPYGSPPRPNAEAPRQSRRSQAVHRDVRKSGGEENAIEPYEHPAPGVTYALSAVIVHIGPYGSGHYIAYARDAGDVWYRYDDRRVFRVDESEVRGCDAYVLFYSKQKPLAAAPDHASVLALSEAAAAAPDCYWLPAQWWQRWLRLSEEPGVIDTESLLCAHGQLKGWLAHSVPRVVWEQLRNKHGASGGALRNGTTQRNGERVVRACEECGAKERLRQHCTAYGAVLLRLPLPSRARHYLLPVAWLRAFNNFVSGRGGVPSPIDVGAEVEAACALSRELVAAVSQEFEEWARNALGLTGEPKFVADGAIFRQVFRGS